MARPWRIEYEGALYHVFSRGNNQQNIFLTDDDRYLFLGSFYYFFNMLLWLAPNSRRQKSHSIEKESTA